MEDRLLLSTFTVSNLNDSGPGSLRNAIDEVDIEFPAGANLIKFTVAGTITLLSPLVPLTNQVNLDGTTAPGFTDHPVIEIDANGFDGLRFNTTASGSAIRSLSIVDTAGRAVTLDAAHVTMVGNYIGVLPDGVTAPGNQGDGIFITDKSFADQIGEPSTLTPFDPTNAISVASNVISGNLGNGITVHGSFGNTIVANYIGTDVTGKLALANSGSGISLEAGAHDNTIGGTVVFNDPNGAVPDSNLISGNAGDGVLISSGAHDNVLAANFIGTDVTGNAPLGNQGDGVDIIGGANNNSILGTFVNEKPFVFANIISGNQGNGIEIEDSNGTVIHANYIGIGVDNQSAVGNALDGILVGGTSDNTQFGGIIPLGNVVSANEGTGIEVRDQASNFISFNSFVGTAAFQPFTNLGNREDGILITSTGANNIVRTSIVSNNRDNGIEIGGEASGVQIDEVIIGLNTDGTSPMPNGANGVLVDGDAHGNLIGSFVASIIPRNIISANLSDGVAFQGTAHGNIVFNSFIGTNSFGDKAFGNAGAGVFLGPGTFGNIVGGPLDSLRNVISGNLGNGVQLSGTTGNVVANNLIGTGKDGILPLPNGGNGVLIANSSNNLIGGFVPGFGNTIAFSSGAGVTVFSGTGNTILGNSIFANRGGGIVLFPGANNNQPAPLLTHIKRESRVTGVGAHLQAAPNTTYRIEIFASRPGRGAQGQTLVGVTNVTTNSSGFARIAVFVPNQSSDSVFTATATSPTGDTSEFSNAVPPAITRPRRR